MAEHVPLEARHLIEAARLAQETLGPAADRDWSAKAGRCDWDCRTTLDHMVNAPVFHATNLAMRSTECIPGVRAGNPNGTVPELIAAIEHSATILARVVAEADPGARGFHPTGRADAQGFAALSMNELLLHTHDISEGLGLRFSPPAELAGLVVRRLFPWASGVAEPWPALLWASGRGSLPNRPDVAGSWAGHPAPLSEWDGSIPTRR